MPHDSKGNLLVEGDKVQLPAVVKSISAGEDFCNLTIESQLGRKPDGYKETVTLNAAVVQKQCDEDCGDCEAEAPANPDFTVVQDGKQQGAWMRKGEATLAAVYKCPAQITPYVAIYPKTSAPETPYAMYIDDKGRVMLQLPPSVYREGPLIVAMDKVVALIDAALPVDYTDAQ